MEGFEFETSSLDYGAIEDEICRYYNLGYPSSSNFMELTEGRSESITIVADNGSIVCNVRAYKKKNSNCFIVSVSSVNLKKKRGK